MARICAGIKVLLFIPPACISRKLFDIMAPGATFYASFILDIPDIIAAVFPRS